VRLISDEFIAIIRDDPPGPQSFSNTALLFMNRQTLDEFKRELVYPRGAEGPRSALGHMFGVPIMLYHGIPIGRWELVRRGSGEHITDGRVWQDEPELAPQLSDVGICQNREHIPEPHIRSNACALWRKVNR